MSGPSLVGSSHETRGTDFVAAGALDRDLLLGILETRHLGLQGFLVLILGLRPGPDSCRQHRRLICHHLAAVAHAIENSNAMKVQPKLYVEVTSTILPKATGLRIIPP